MEKISETKNNLKIKVENQELRVKIVSALAFNRTPKMAAEARKNESYETEIIYRGENTTLVTELEVLSELKMQLGRAIASWETLQESKWILMSVLGHDRALAQLI